MRNLVLRLALAASIAAALASAQTAQPKAKAQAKAAARRAAPIQLGQQGALRQRMLKNLDLSDAQKAQVKEIFQQQQNAAKPVRQELVKARQALAAAVKNNDTIQIQQLAAAQAAVQGRLLALQAGAMAKFYAILTPDQQAKAAKMRQKVTAALGTRAARRAVL